MGQELGLEEEVIASVLQDWFGWPDGAVLTNLIASAIWVGFGVWRIVKSQRKLHEKLDKVHKHLGID